MSKIASTKVKTPADFASQGHDDIDAQIAKLDEAVEWFYGDDFSLSQAVEKYQSAIKLAENIDRSLDQLENQVEVLSIDFAKE